MANAEGFEGEDYGMGEAGWDDLFGIGFHSGVIPESVQSLQVYTDEDGAQIKVRPGRSLIRGTRKVWDTVTRRTVTPNFSATLPRMDLVVQRKNPETKDIEIDVLPGVAATNPVLPSATRVVGGKWEEPLAYLSIPANFGRPGGPGSITAAMITDLRTTAGPIDKPGDLHETASTVLPPFGWAFPQGGNIRRDAFPRLFAALGTYWGTGDGSRTFGAPDVRYRTPRGSTHTSNTTYAGDGTLGIYAGSDTVTLANNNLPNNVMLIGNTPQANYVPQSPGGPANSQVTYVSGGGVAVVTIPRVFVVNYMLRLC